MKFFVLALLFVAASAAPAPDNGEPVELIVNGVPEGAPLDIGDVLDIKVKEHADGEVVASSDLLFPLTAEGIAEAAAAEVVEEAVPVESVAVPLPGQPEIEAPVEIQPIVMPAPEQPEVVEEPIAVQPIVMPEPAQPEVVEEPIAVQPIVMPAPEQPEVIDTAEPIPVAVVEDVIPEPAAQGPNGEVFNNGLVEVQVNAPEASVLSTIQSWFSLFVNYINNGIQSTQQVV